MSRYLGVIHQTAVFSNQAEPAIGGLAQRIRATRGPMTGSGVTHRFRARKDKDGGLRLRLTHPARERSAAQDHRRLLTTTFGMY
jgi:hypothetical protein